MLNIVNLKMKLCGSAINIQIRFGNSKILFNYFLFHSLKR